MNQKSSNRQDRTKKVLIVGNGVSRQEQKVDQFIRDWKEDELWACNWAYKEYDSGDLPRLDLLIGDYTSLKESVPFIAEKGWNTAIYGKNARSYSLSGVKQPPIDQHFIRDSGTTLVAMALELKYDEVYIAGFDLGGKDIYQPKHDKRNKSIWVENWRRILKHYGLAPICFVGFDHKPFIMSDKPSDSYAQIYMRGKNHIGAVEV